MRCPILLDEREARIVAQTKGLKILGMVGLLEEAALKGLVDLPNALERLKRTNARIKASIIRESLERYQKSQPTIPKTDQSSE